MTFNLKLAIYVSLLIIFSISYAHAGNLVPVTGFARSFLMNTDISNATLTILETGQQITTDATGRFSFQYPEGKPLTLEFKKWGYKTTQSGTVIVPPGGLTGPYDNITFQIPSTETFYLLQAIIGAKLDDNACHVVTTITAYHKTLEDCPQGETGSKLVLTPYVSVTPFYFGAYDDGHICKTNPFTKGLTVTSEDGGAGYFNLPPRDEPYTLSAVKDGVRFSEAQFICRKGAFINISPPRGPMAKK